MDEHHSALCLGAGTYRGGGGRGVYAVCRDAGGRWTTVDAFDGALNASFSVYSARHGLHYIVDERASGRVGVFRYRDRGWSKLASVATNGAAPCHVALDRRESLLAVANYAGGSVSLMRLDARTGLPAGRVEVSANSGSGPNPQRQEGPHAHWVGFSGDGRWLYQTDLGTDEVLAFAIDEDAELGPPRRAYAAPPGSGPRHLLLHPRLDRVAYLASELASTLTTLDHADGAFGDPRIVSTLPDGWHGENIVAHLGVNRAADRLYVSNRGHDSIAVFALDAAGVPTLLQHVPAGGTFPRFFLLLEDERLMMVANEKSQTVSALAIGDDGRLSTTGVTLPVPGVAYLLRVDHPNPLSG